MATHSSTLAWRSPWTEEPAGLKSVWLQRVGHNWVANTFTKGFCFIFIIVSKPPAHLPWTWERQRGCRECYSFFQETPRFSSSCLCLNHSRVTIVLAAFYVATVPSVFGSISEEKHCYLNKKSTVKTQLLEPVREIGQRGKPKSPAWISLENWRK